MASITDINNNVLFNIDLIKLAIIDGEPDSYKYISFNGYLKHGNSVINMGDRNYISIELLKNMISSLKSIYSDVLTKRSYDDEWANYAIEPLDQSFMLEVEFQGFENEDPHEEIVEVRISFHSYNTTKGQYPGYRITITFGAHIDKLGNFAHELTNEFNTIRLKSYQFSKEQS